MVKSMRTRFDEQLRQLNVELIRMGSLCEEAISIAAKVLEGEKNISNERVFAIEGEIDQLEHDIESLCMRMLLQQQPVASDLRVISAALKMISDMERIGDQQQILQNCAHTLEIPRRADYTSPIWQGQRFRWSPKAWKHLYRAI